MGARAEEAQTAGSKAKLANEDHSGIFRVAFLSPSMNNHGGIVFSIVMTVRT